jgi:hypothetical protein
MVLFQVEASVIPARLSKCHFLVQEKKGEVNVRIMSGPMPCPYQGMYTVQGQLVKVIVRLSVTVNLGLNIFVFFMGNGSVKTRHMSCQYHVCKTPFVG